MIRIYTYLLASLLTYTCLSTSVDAITQAELIERTRLLVKKQKAETDAATAKLKSAQGINKVLHGELDAKQKEFDDTVNKWVAYGDDQHAKWMDAEQRVTAKQKTIDHLLKQLHLAKWIFSGLITAVIVLVCLKLGIPPPFVFYIAGAAVAGANAAIWIFL